MMQPRTDQQRLLQTGVYLLFFLLINTFSYNYHFKIGINIYLSDIFLGLLFALTLMRWLRQSPPLFQQSYLFLFLVIFIYYIFQVFYAYSILGNSIADVFGRFKNLFIYPLLFFVGLTFTTEKRQMEKYFSLIQVQILFALLFGLLSLKYQTLDVSAIYASGEVVDSQYFMLVSHGTALFCCLIFVYHLLQVAQKGPKPLKSVIFMSLSVIGILGTQNRSVLVSFLIMIVLIFFYSRKADILIKTRIKLILSGLILFLVVIAIFLLQSPLYNKFEKRINETVSTFSGSREFFNTNSGIRVGRTIAAFNEWKKSPIFGCGWGTQITEFKIYDFDGRYVRTNYGTPHNYYITILYQTGIIGFFFMMIFFYQLYQGIKPRTHLNSQSIMGYSLFIFYIAFMVFNVANTHFYGDPVFIPVFFFLLGVMAGYAHAVNHQQRLHETPVERQ